jgi:hypothetical protein
MVVAFAAFAFAAPARAYEVAPADPVPAAGVLRLLPPPSTTRYAISLGERSIAYSATAGTLPLRDTKGVTTAEIFHVAYAADPPVPDRPITFVSNGGPGAASAFLHLGAIGPRLVAFDEAGDIPRPPARLIDNPDTWLEFTDRRGRRRTVGSSASARMPPRWRRSFAYTSREPGGRSRQSSWPVRATADSAPRC